MIGLWKGQGGVLRRIAGEVVPFAIGFVAASMAVPFLGLWGGLGAGIAVGFAFSALLVCVRRHTVPRRIYRALLAVHVVFWSVLGVVDSSPGRRPGPVVPAGRVAWGQATTFKAGVGCAFFDLPERTPLGGWGTMVRRRALPAFGGIGTLGRLSLYFMGPPEEGAAPRAPMFRRPARAGDALGARALLLLPDDGGPAVAFVRMDLIVPERRLVADVLGDVGHLHLTPETLLLSATHTHSGPGGFQRIAFAAISGTDHFDRAVYDAVRRAIVEALRVASRDARPARLAFPRARDRGASGLPILARNRCRAHGGIDDRVLALRVEDAKDGHVRALLLHYAVQPVMLRPRHLAFGRDLPGAIEDALGRALPGHPLILFLNGAMGDVSPRSMPPGGEEGAARMARAFAERVVADLQEGPAFDHLRVRAARVERDLGTPFTFVSVGSRAAFARRVVPSAWGDDAPSVLANLIALPANALLWSLGLSEVRAGFTFDGAAGVLLVPQGAWTRMPHPFGALVLDAGREGVPPVPKAVLLWQGGIPTEAVGRSWRRSVEARELPTPFVMSLTNDVLGYVTTEEEYDGSCAYEARATFHGRESARLVGEGLDRALDDAMGAGAEEDGSGRPGPTRGSAPVGR